MTIFCHAVTVDLKNKLLSMKVENKKKKILEIESAIICIMLG